MMKHQNRIILAGMMGNLVESFDLALCGLMSFYIAKYLMADSSKGILVVFATFFIGYIARPIGALFLGLFSDIYGRKLTLSASILSMGIATTSIGFIPEKSAIGIYSLILLLVLRLIQSFCCGAEYLNSSAYLIENAKKKHKGYSGSWASFGAMSGLLLASIVSMIIAYAVEQYPNMEWLIWRIPFILALLGSSIGLYIRLFVPESLEYVMYYSEQEKPEFNDLLKTSINKIREEKMKSFYVFVLSFLGVATTFQIYIYGPTQAHRFGQFTDHQISVSNIISLIVVLSLFPNIGRLTDIVNREKIVLFASFGFLSLSPLYFYSISYGSYQALLLSQALISIPAACYYATVPVMLAQMYPFHLRCTVLSILYSIAASLAAGLTPVLSYLLVSRTNLGIAPVVFNLIVIMITLSAIYQRKKRLNKV